ncbi:hypothetical protein P691DRAFT_701374 [Macrolepiota fuliginosa MF-IS2]|uniref:Uncharacterized protein n=1 Tax=Macrolepiota fuliginosa MF-IS2 TaxID=1400762 RepID=A0A9P5XG80_9AGAR|nr:hypothetical protein P691DRAFT_701374 [Macrolepiota fuliginosa MF-IS2]
MDCSDDDCESYTSDTVQWQGTQTACAALDTLLSEASFKSQVELFQAPRDSTSRASSSSSGFALYSHRQASPLASTSMSLSLPSFTNASDSGKLRPFNATSSSASVSNGLEKTSSWKVSSNDHRGRSSRSSASQNVEESPVRDPDQFLSMLKGISERLDGSIRSDASSSKDLKRRQSSMSDAGGKRVRHSAYSKPSHRSVSEGIGKGKAQDFGALACTSLNIPNSLDRTAGVTKNRSVKLRELDSAMGVAPPKPSREIMPPPPVPLSRATVSASQAPHRNTPNFPPTRPPAVKIEVVDTPPPQLPPHTPQPKPTIQIRDAAPSTKSNPTPTQTPKLHPLLDPERKQRRLKLERTISATLASLDSKPSSTSSSPSDATPPVPSVRQPQLQPQQPQRRFDSNHHQPPSLTLSQGRAAGNPSRPPSLGMRRTHTFPLASQSSSTTGGNLEKPLPTKKGFKPPLFLSSQPPSTPSTNSSSPRSNASSSEQFFSPMSNTSPLSSTPSSKLGDEDMDDLLPSSDADLSFGEAVPLDVDMDALEETMRKYD